MARAFFDQHRDAIARANPATLRSRAIAERAEAAEGDASSASYFLAAGAISGLSGGGPVRVEGVGRASIQGDLRFTEILERMGAEVAIGENWIEAGTGNEAAKRGRFKALDADLNHIPDAAMTAAVAALFADGPSTLRNIGSWRVKETDRIHAMHTELTKLGARVESGADWIRVFPLDFSDWQANIPGVDYGIFTAEVDSAVVAQLPAITQGGSVDDALQAINDQASQQMQ